MLWVVVCIVLSRIRLVPQNDARMLSLMFRTMGSLFVDVVVKKVVSRALILPSFARSLTVPMALCRLAFGGVGRCRQMLHMAALWVRMILVSLMTVLCVVRRAMAQSVESVLVVPLVQQLVWMNRT